MIKDKLENAEIEILNAAKEIFQQKGMDGARMQEIADKAKINKALLHYYYRSKQLLFEAVFSNAFALLAPQLNKVLNDDSDLFEKIRQFTDSYITFVINHPYLPNFVIIFSLRSESSLAFGSLLKTAERTPHASRTMTMPEIQSLCISSIVSTKAGRLSSNLTVLELRSYFWFESDIGQRQLRVLTPDAYSFLGY